MTFGELVKDFLRVAAVPARSRWVVQVLGPRLQRYLLDPNGRHGIHWTITEAASMVLLPAAVHAFPATALGSVGKAILTVPVHATCIVAAPIDETLSLYAYLIHPTDDPPDTSVSDKPAAVATASTSSPEPTSAGMSVRQRQPRAGGAREEILSTARRLMRLGGSTTFTIDDVLREMRRSGTAYADATIRTMIAVHLSGTPGGDGYTDLERVERGVYQIRPGTAK